ncbi:hypothetical protein D9756_001186 [Leucocoprinus leucothites]|uniref:Uncharacterized protein n=1 Tax=Leucocoprinus leucothites TaxID=201217 RepID=A0A8H5G3W7_9AGAR|nr:hypothetical protein D9756_001186 [Leucoagaricus leucothites]
MTTAVSTATLVPGTYKILCKGGELGTARTWMTMPSSRIFVDNIEKGDYAKWQVSSVAEDGDTMWHIRNIVVEDILFAEPKEGAKITGRDSEEEGLRDIMWRLEGVGQGIYRIGYPGTGLVWTAESVPTKIPGRMAWEIFLHEKADGIPEQEFKFVLLPPD